MAAILGATMYLIVRRILRPISRLQRGAEIIGEGDLDYRAGATSKDEMGDLSRAFDNMTARLHTTTVSRDQLAVEVTLRQHAEESAKLATEETRLLYSTTLAAATTESFDESLQRCLDLVCEYVGWPLGHVYVPDAGGTGVLESTSVWHLQDPQGFKVFQNVTERTTFEPGIGLPGRVWMSGKPTWIPDVQRDDNFPRNKEAREIGVRGGFAFPIRIGNETVAVLEFFSSEPAEEDEHLLELLAVVGSQFGRLFERQRAQAELESAYKELQELDQLKDNFLSNVSHELRTPLTSIKGSAEILLSYDDVDQDVQTEFLTIINNESERLTRLINDVLDLSRIESGLQHWEDAEQSVIDVVKTAVAGTKVLASQKDLQVHLNLDDELSSVWCDKDKLVQVVTNLLSNAIKFTPEGGEIRVSVRVGSSDGPNDQDGVIQIDVSDTGIGIAAEDKEGVFEKFKQVGDTLSDLPKGTGLGLPISREIIEHYGGRIWVESELGIGSTFFFTIPAGPKQVLVPETARGDGKKS